jgi:hypothetical protein
MQRTAGPLDPHLTVMRRGLGDVYEQFMGPRNGGFNTSAPLGNGMGDCGIWQAWLLGGGSQAHVPPLGLSDSRLS